MLQSMRLWGNQYSTEHLIFYEDEVDIHLNPKISVDWQLCGQ